MKFFSLTFFLFLLFSCNSEEIASNPSGNRLYFDKVYDIEISSNIKFGEALQPTLTNPNNTQPLFLDFYQPIATNVEQRPLIILAFGGAFVFGSKDNFDIVTLCKEFAKRGYACAAIDYRLSPSLVFNSTLPNVYEAILKATHDMRASIRFFHKDAATDNLYKINTSKIFIGGVSAGAITALQIAHLDHLSEVPESFRATFNSMGGFEGNSGNLGYPDDFAGLINICGAMLNVDHINPLTATPTLSFHGTDDTIVPYTDGNLVFLMSSLPVSGSAAIHEKLDELNISNQLYTYEDEGHTPYVTNRALLDSTEVVMRDFLYPFVQ